MIETADIVADRYKVSREYQDEYSLESQKRTAAAQDGGLYDNEIVPMDTKMIVKDKESGETSVVDYTVTKDECNRPNTTIDGLQKLKPIRGEEHYITAGNASQLSDGAPGSSPRRPPRLSSVRAASNRRGPASSPSGPAAGSPSRSI